MTDVAVLSIPIEGDPKKLEAALAKIEADLRKAEGAGRRAGAGVAAGFDQAGPAARRAEQGSLAFARALAQLQRESGQTAQAIRTLEGALAGQTQAGTAYINTQRQMIRYQRELAAEAQVAARGGQSLSKAFGALGTALSAVGIGFAVDQVIQLGIGSVQSANQLEQTTAVMRQLAGSAERYDQIVQLATDNQRLFGGSLNSNLGPLNALLQLANRTGAELQNLNRTTQLLLASAPNKTFGDASFSLSEFLSNTGAEAALSLADQFNLNKKALAELAREGTTAEERLAGLNALLAEQGVTAETLAARLNTTAQSYVELGAEFDRLQTSFGQGLADAFEQPTRGLTRLLGLINQNPQAWAELKALLGGRGQITSADVDAVARDMAEKQARSTLLAPGDAGRGRANNASVIAGFGGQEQFDAIVQRMVAIQQAGGPAAEALARLNEQFRQGEVDAAAYRERLASIEQINADPLIAIGAASARLATDFQAGATGAATLDGRMQALAGTSQANALAIIANAQAYADGRISAAELEGAIAALEQAQAAQASASDESSSATLGLADSLVAAAKAVDGTTLASRAQKSALEDAAHAAFEAENAGKGLEDQARAAAQALYDAGGAGAAAAAQLAQSSADVDVLTASIYRLLAAKEAALGAGGLVGNLGRIKGAGAVTEVDRLLRKHFGAGPLAPAKPPKGRRGGSGSGGSGKSEAEREAEREAEQLRRIADQYHERQLAAERTYQERLTDITEEYARRRAEAARDFSDQQVEDRLAFYKSLKNIDDQAIRQQASAEFEAFAIKAAELRDTEGADVAREYEAEAARIAAARAQRNEELKKLEEEAKKDKSRAGDLQYARDLDRMEREAEQRRLDRIAEGEGSLDDQEAQALADAEAQRQQALADAATTAGKAIADIEREKADAANTTNLALIEQLRLYDQLAQRGGLPPGAALPAGGITPASAGLPAPAASTAIEVTSAQLAEVITAAVTSAVQSLTGAIAEGAATEAAATGRAASDLGRKIDGLKKSGPMSAGQ